jgi:hypothetical protein
MEAGRQRRATIGWTSNHGRRCGKMDIGGAPLEAANEVEATMGVAEAGDQPAAARKWERPLSRFPLRGKAGAGGFPPRRRHTARQQKALARIDATGSPHKRTAVPLWIPCRGLCPCDPAHGSTSRLTGDGPLMEAASVSEL